MQVFLLFCLQGLIRIPPQIIQDIRGYRFVLLPNRTGDLYRRICRRKIHIKCSFRKGFPLFRLLKIVNVDVFLSCDAVFKVQTFFVGVQVILRNADLAAFGNGDRDLVPFYGYDIKNDGIFSVKELKFFQIEFVHETPP